MFNWLGNIFPYSDLHSLNLDWILSKMKETAAQAAKAVADAANALAQVAEAKAAALSAQTAAQDAQTAANKAAGNAASAAANAVQALNAAQTAQETATAANNKAQTAQETATAANNKAQTAQETATAANSAAQTAQNTANTAQSAAQSAQSAAETANEEMKTLKGRFPIKTADIADNAVTSPKLAKRSVALDKLSTTNSYLYRYTDASYIGKFPRSGSATLDQIMSGIVDTQLNTFSTVHTEYLQAGIDITEENQSTPNTIFRCISPVVSFINKTSAGLVAIAPIIVIKNDTYETYNGFIKLTQERVDNIDFKVTCKVIFNTTPPFNDNTKFVINAYPIWSNLNLHV